MAILAAAVVHFVTDDQNPHAIIETYKRALPPGGFLALSHCTIPQGFDEASQKPTKPCGANRRPRGFTRATRPPSPASSMDWTF
ncbi:hypothetical protein GCM10010411_75960 [Actinomadura fulvescens]|uniref:Uncharacterized protein n=1 Tax=Actinomadura fulvescens TaxID=46160 RepID=A0ABN3QIS4_9ACTN